MSPPSKDSPENQPEDEKLSVEEQGGTCPNPTLHQEPNERAYEAMLFMKAELGEFVPQLHFMLYFMFGTRPQIEKQIIQIRKFLKGKVPLAIPVSFLRISPDVTDNFSFPIPLCGQGSVKFAVIVDEKICFIHLDPNKIAVSNAVIEEKSKKCLYGTHIHEMQLQDANLPASIEFFLLRNERDQDSVRKATNFKLVIQATDKGGNEITTGNHSVEKVFAACFYDADALPQNDHKAESEKHPLMPINGKRILENYHDEISRKLGNWPPMIEWCVTNGLLHKRFLKPPYDLLTEERKGEILRHLYEAENIFPKFIEALKASQNEELVNLLQCKLESMGDQNYSLE